MLDQSYPVVGDPVYHGLIFYDSKSPYNVSTYADPEVDKLLREARSIFDTEERIELLTEVQTIMAEELGVIEVVWPGTHVAVKDGIEGFVLYPDNTIRYYQLHPSD